jgi:hypothetical protein
MADNNFRDTSVKDAMRKFVARAILFCYGFRDITVKITGHVNADPNDLDGEYDYVFPDEIVISAGGDRIGWTDSL